MNRYIVKPAGLRWIVTWQGSSSSNATFTERDEAIEYAEILAQASRPSVLEIYNSTGQFESSRDFPHPRGVKEA